MLSVVASCWLFVGCCLLFVELHVLFGVFGFPCVVCAVRCLLHDGLVLLVGFGMLLVVVSCSVIVCSLFSVCCLFVVACGCLW